MTVAKTDFSDAHVGSRMMGNSTDVYFSSSAISKSPILSLGTANATPSGAGVVQGSRHSQFGPQRTMISRAPWSLQASGVVRECPAPQALGIANCGPGIGCRHALGHQHASSNQRRPAYPHPVMDDQVLATGQFVDELGHQGPELLNIQSSPVWRREPHKPYACGFGRRRLPPRGRVPSVPTLSSCRPGDKSPARRSEAISSSSQSPPLGLAIVLSLPGPSVVMVNMFALIWGNAYPHFINRSVRFRARPVP